MALRETIHTANSDFIRQEFCNLINLRHPLVHDDKWVAIKLGHPSSTAISGQVSFPI